MKSVREELASIESRVDKVSELRRKLREDYLHVLYTGSKQDVEQFQINLALEEEEYKAINSKLAELRDRHSAIIGRMGELQRTVFGLSTSALALSVTFSSSLIPDQPKELDLLRLAWILFTASVIAFPCSVLVDLSESMGFRPVRLFSALKLTISPLVFGFFLGGVIYFLQFALANLPTT